MDRFWIIARPLILSLVAAVVAFILKRKRQRNSGVFAAVSASSATGMVPCMPCMPSALMEHFTVALAGPRAVRNPHRMNLAL